MPRYRICANWTMCKMVEIEADTLEQAIEVCENDCSADDGEYVDESFYVLTDACEEITEEDA